MKVIEKHWNKGGGPDLMLVVLHDSSPDIYRSVKQRVSFYAVLLTSRIMLMIIHCSFGDIVRGVATQCLRSTKCIRANKQYFANVCLKWVALVFL